jgi:chemotaxis protein MotB
MRRNKLFSGICLICFFLAACVSKEEYEKLEAALFETQAAKRAQLEQKNIQIRELDSKLKLSQENREKLQKEYAALKVSYDNLEKTNLHLSRRLEGLGVELEKKDSIVQQKEDILRQYAEAKRKLESELENLQAQVEAREQKIKNKAAEIEKLNDTERQIKTSIQNLKSSLDARQKKIVEQEQIISELDSTKRQIEINLKEQIKDQQIKLEEMEGKLKVTFVDKILFDSGSVEINENGKALLSKLAQTLREKKDQHIIIQGHTDNVEIGPELRKKYPTNWELSAGRSAAVLRYLIEHAGIAPVRCAACGYSFYKPVASNATEAGREQNRRIEILLVPAREF